MYLLKNNQVEQFVKFMILSMSRTHVGDLSRPGVQWQFFTLKLFLNKEEIH